MREAGGRILDNVAICKYGGSQGFARVSWAESEKQSMQSRIFS
jgi:hypothetical protein